jgi:hypothetical protein
VLTAIVIGLALFAVAAAGVLALMSASKPAIGPLALACGLAEHGREEVGAALRHTPWLRPGTRGFCGTIGETRARA